MVLVSYSDSESDTCQPGAQSPTTTTAQSSRKRKIEDTPTATGTTKSPPPLPSSFHSLYATNVRTSTTDDPSLHGGRKRQVAHVPGNWPSHVFLEWLPDKSQLELLDDLIQQARRVVITNSDLSENDFKLNSFLRSSLFAQLPLHISLSAPLVLSASIKDDFRHALVDAVDVARIGEITLRPLSLDLVPNFERSRWFLVLRVGETGDKKLMTLLRVCNGVCDGFGLPLLYQNGDVVGVDTANEATRPGERRTKKNKVSGDGEPDVGGSVQGELYHDTTDAFHISIAWALEEVSENARSAIRRIDMKIFSSTTIEFDRVKIKVGNVVDDIPL